MFRATVKGGLVGGALGLVGGTTSVWYASKRYPGFRALGLPFRAFLATSAMTFAGMYNPTFVSSTHPTGREGVMH